MLWLLSSLRTLSNVGILPFDLHLVMMMVMMMMKCRATTPDTAHRSKSVKFLEAAQDIGLQVLI